MVRALVVCTAAGLVGIPAAAQDWGTSSVGVLTVPYTQFSTASVNNSPLDGDPTFPIGARCVGPTLTCVGHAGVSLPSGALVVGLDMESCDFVQGGRALLELFHCEVDTLLCTSVAAVATDLNGEPGCATVGSPALNITVHNAAGYLAMIAKVEVPSAGAGVFFRAARLRYRLQVSPAPALATFPNDVPVGHPIFRFVEALAAAGITGGCGAGSYCPDSPLTRGQMAVFLATALGLHFPN